MMMMLMMLIIVIAQVSPATASSSTTGTSAGGEHCIGEEPSCIRVFFIAGLLMGVEWTEFVFSGVGLFVATLPSNNGEPPTLSAFVFLSFWGVAGGRFSHFRSGPAP